MNFLTDEMRNFERSADITELSISATIQNKSFAGTDDKNLYKYGSP